MKFTFSAALVALSALTTLVSGHGTPERRNDGGLTTVNLRIEGKTKTIFEGVIHTKGHNVTTKSGGTHKCNGLNNHANTRAGPTCTSALDDGKFFGRYSFDGTFDKQFDDFFITKIGPDAQTSSEFWGLLLNFHLTSIGGCQQEVRANDKVLWAFDAFNKNHFLKLTGPSSARKGQSVTLIVTDGKTGKAVAGASVAGKTTDSNGKVSVTFETKGGHSYKAEKSDSIRSNALDIVVF